MAKRSAANKAARKGFKVAKKRHKKRQLTCKRCRGRRSSGSKNYCQRCWDEVNAADEKRQARNRQLLGAALGAVFRTDINVTTSSHQIERPPKLAKRRKAKRSPRPRRPVEPTDVGGSGTIVLNIICQDGDRVEIAESNSGNFLVLFNNEPWTSHDDDKSDAAEAAAGNVSDAGGAASKDRIGELMTFDRWIDQVDDGLVHDDRKEVAT